MPWNKSKDPQTDQAMLSAKLWKLQQDPDIREYVSYSQLSLEEQLKRREAWTKYYEACKETTAAFLLDSIRPAAEKKDFARVAFLRDLCTEHHRMQVTGELPHEIQKPVFSDPVRYEYEQKFETLRSLVGKQKQLKELQNYDSSLLTDD